MSSDPIRVIVASRDAHTRGRITRLIASHHSFHVTEVDSERALEAHLEQVPVDLVVSDLLIPASDSIVHGGSHTHGSRQVGVIEIRDAKVDRRRTALTLHPRDFSEQPFSRDELTCLARSRDNA